MPVFRNPFYYDQELSVLVVGVGGNGSKLATGLKSLALALEATKDQRLHVTLVDPDVVEESNLARQNYYPTDLGKPKAVVLAHRINLATGLQWKALPRELRPEDLRYGPDIVITATDNRKRRALVRDYLSPRQLWLDLGNEAQHGQVVLGGFGLPTSAELWPEVADTTLDGPDAPSCSVLEALFQQDLYVNDVAAIFALNLLWQLLFRNELTYHGVVFDLARGEVSPIPVSGNEKERKAA